MKRIIVSEDSLKKSNETIRCVLVLYIEGKKIGYLSKASFGYGSAWANCMPEINRYVKIHRAERWAKQYLNNYMCWVDEFYIRNNDEYDYARRYKGNWTLYKNREIVKETQDAEVRIEPL